MAYIVTILRSIVEVMDHIGIVLGLLVGTFLLGYELKQPTPQEQPRTILTKLAILSITSGGEAFQGAPAFETDSLDALQRAHPEGIVGLITSEELCHCQHFSWVISVAEELQSDFAFSARAAYLVNADGDPSSFYLLNSTARYGPPYREIIVPVNQPEKGGHVVVVLCIYPKTSKVKFPGNVKQILATRVE